jgi:hypothetical protein
MQALRGGSAFGSASEWQLRKMYGQDWQQRKVRVAIFLASGTALQKQKNSNLVL